MAPKSILCLFVFVLVSRMGSSVNAGTQAPVYAPILAPTYAPTTPLPYGFGTACVAMCATHCRPIYPRRACMRTCTACCAKFRCVPEFSNCCSWEYITVRGKSLKCP